MLAINNGKEVSDDEQKTASLMCNAAIEARVIGLDKPAMSITGSGAHGIIATMPLYAAYKVNGYTEEQLLRATALSYLVCMYIKRVFRTIISILWLCYRCRFWYGMCTGLFTRWNSRNDGSYIE